MATVFQARDPHAALRAAQKATVAVAGVAIPPARIMREMQHHRADTPHEAWQAAARALAVRELLLAEARRLGLKAEPRDDGEGRIETDEEALIRAVAESQIVAPEPDEASCRRYYERNLHRFRSAELCEASHILLPARPDDAPARALQREKAEALIARLAEEPSDFSRLAEVHSACPSRTSGGCLGQIKRGDTVPEFEAALAALRPGEIARQPVETRFGFHVVRLDRRIAGRQLPFELVGARIAAYLAERARRLATAQFLAVLGERFGVEGIDLPRPADLGAMYRPNPMSRTP
jgi:peptidyl-prolyl cis-trans isomerase C